MKRALTPRRLMLACTAAAGIVAAHALDYLVVLPDDHLRRRTLALSGHGYLPRAVVIAISGAILAALAAAALGLARGRGRDIPPLDYASAATRIAALQVGGFLTLEIVERLATGSRFGHHSPALIAVGVGLQVFFSFVGALILRIVSCAAEAVARALAPRPPARAPARLEPTPRADRAHDFRFSSSSRVRAPPHAA
jgi:hypothetical protein